MTDILSSDFSEPGFLKRLRNWRDAMPWLAMGDCLAPATSTVAMLLSMIALLLGGFGVFSFEWLLRDYTLESIPAAAQFPSALPPSKISLLSSDLVDTPVFISVLEYLTGPVRLAPNRENMTACFVRIMQQLFLIAIWIIPAGYTMRQTALAIAGRERMATLDAIKMVSSRFLSFLSGPMLTLGVAIFLSTFFLILGLSDRIPYVGQAISNVGGLLGIPIALLIGLLGFGTFITFPLMWASIVSESYSDGFDSASRGFEYVIQRPFRFVAYIAIAVVLSTVAFRLVSSLVFVGTALAQLSFSTATTAPKGLPTVVVVVLQTIPIAFAFNLFWAFSTGIYLLLRRDANHQEIEDVWEPERPQAKPLPEVGNKPPPAEDSSEEDNSSS